jgi:hypothetical protein
MGGFVIAQSQGARSASRGLRLVRRCASGAKPNAGFGLSTKPIQEANGPLTTLLRPCFLAR